MKNKKQTLPRIAAMAGQLLANPNLKERQLAGSALAQAATKRRRAR